MKNFRIPLVVALFALVGAVCIAASPTNLRCEFRNAPQGIDATKPRLSWNMTSDKRGARQTAYQVLVATSADKLTEGAADLWDSGKVESDKSLQICYAGKPLASRTECFWKVRVWDADGNASEWSPPAHWTMGLLAPADWKAKWIGLDGEDVQKALTGTTWIWFPEDDPATAVPVAARYFRRTLDLPKDREIRRARLLFTADDDCKGFINGRDIGGRDNHKNVKDADITYRLQPGKNSIAVLCHNKGTTPNPAGFVALLTIEFDKGEPMVIRSDEAWKATDTESGGWNELAFDDASWVPARVIGPVGMEPWGDVRGPEDRRLPARWLRKEFNVGGDVRRATATYCGLGLSELYLNGAKVGDDVMSPAATQYPKRVLYVTHDVTKQLKSGENAIGAVLGNGRYFSMRSKVYSGMPHFGFPKLLLNLHIDYADGTSADIVSDESWKLSADGPILANNEYDGEEYDARKEFAGWNRTGFDESKWQPAQLVPAPEGVVAAQMIEPIRVTQTLRPVAVNEIKPGIFIFDMGQNMVGWCRLKATGPAGTEIQLRHAETRQPDGTLYLANLRGAKVTDIYTLKGGGEETWEPRFTYHGFRFVEVTGFPGKPTLDSIEGRVVNDDVEAVGQFACSNPLINQIYRNVVWGVRGNYRSVPTDCPQRDERQGWLGDRSEESKGESYIFDIAALYSKWLQDMADSQKDTGSLPDVCPAHWPIYSDNVTWPSSAVIIPNMLRRQYADEAIIARQYDSAKKWMDYMLKFVEGGIISRDSYGDWCVPPEDPALIHSKDPARITDKALLATSYFYHDLRLMQQYAKMLGKTEDSKRFDELANQTSEAFNAKFLNRELGQYDNGTQTSCVLPLYFGLVPKDQEQRIFDHLVKKITDETHNHIGTGLVGGQFLNQVLTDHGRADLAYTIASQSDYPSWGYMVSQGATTIWELWNGNTADPAMNSGNHVMLVGDLVIWLYEDVAGIQPDDAEPGFKRIIMRPTPVGDLKNVESSFRSQYGLISSEWRKEGDTFDWQVSVPANTSATIYVPAKNADTVSEGGKPAATAEGVKFVRTEGDRAVFEIGSGNYHFTSK
jgi:alpha-L-rhamnosidase